MNQEPDHQTAPKAKRRSFTSEYKLRILAEADNCTQRGEISALLRREGLYPSHLAGWRKQCERGELDETHSPKRGRKSDPQAAELARLQRENAQLRSRLEQAERIIDIQEKLAQLLGTTPAEPLSSEENPIPGADDPRQMTLPLTPASKSRRVSTDRGQEHRPCRCVQPRPCPAKRAAIPPLQTSPHPRPWPKLRINRAVMRAPLIPPSQFAIHH